MSSLQWFTIAARPSGTLSESILCRAQSCAIGPLHGKSWEDRRSTFNGVVRHMRWIAKVVSALMISAGWLLGAPADARAACAGGTETAAQSVTREFDSGAKWSFNVSIAPCEGLVLSNVRYRAAFQTERLVLNRATLAEVHVPYDNNAARFLDVTDSTSGLGASALTLAAAECGGTLHHGNKVCVEEEDGGYRYKSRSVFAEMHGIAVFMASQLGEYTYINRWEFLEDGTIEPSVGLTGQLQIISSNAADAPQFGSHLGQAGQPARVGLNHMHNFYYRLDFDLNGSGNDVAHQVSYAASSAGSGCAGNACGRTTFTPITSEAAQTWSASAQVTWLVQDKSILNADGRRIGYDIKPHLGGVWRGKNDGTEPWAQHDLFVTRYKLCERFAARNLQTYLGSSCGTSNPQHVAAMVNGESTDGQDIVIWFVNRHHHVTRDEDEFYMPIEWTGFEIKPRQWSENNPSQD